MTIAQTAARVETMKRVLQDGCVSVIHQICRCFRVWSAYKIEAGESRFAFWLTLTKYAWCGSVKAPGNSFHSGVSTYKHAQCRNERNDLEQPPEREEYVTEHRKVLPKS